MSRDIRVLLVKLADRLHNMRTLHFVRDPERRKRIARETMEIYAPLAERIGMDAVKTELQTLAFAQLEPEAYATIQARLNFLRGQGADVIEEVRARTAPGAARRPASSVLEVTGREKSPYLDLGEDAAAATWPSSSCPTSWRSASWCRPRRPATRRSARCIRPIR